MYKVYTDVGGIKQLYHVCPPVRKIIHSLKLADFLHVQADNPWYNYYLGFSQTDHNRLSSIKKDDTHASDMHMHAKSDQNSFKLCGLRIMNIFTNC